MANSINLDEQAQLQSLTTRILKDGAVTPSKIDPTSSFTFAMDLSVTGNLIVTGTGSTLPAGIIRPSNISALTSDNFVFPNSVDTQALFVHGNLDLNNQLAKNFRIENVTSTPVNGNPGRLIWRSDLGTLLVDTGSGFSTVYGGLTVNSIQADSHSPLNGSITFASGAGISLSQSGSVITVNSSAITQLTGDVMAFGPGSATTSIVGGAITPSKISTTNTDDFTFPRSVFATGGLVSDALTGLTAGIDFHPAVDSTGAFNFWSHTHNTLFVQMDSINFRVGVNCHPSFDLDVASGTINSFNSYVGAGNSGQLSVGSSNPHPSAKMDVSSTTQGVLLPRMQTSDRDAIVSPEEGLHIYNLTLHKLQVWDGTTWQSAW